MTTHNVPFAEFEGEGADPPEEALEDDGIRSLRRAEPRSCRLISLAAKQKYPLQSFLRCGADRAYARRTLYQVRCSDGAPYGSDRGVLATFACRHHRRPVAAALPPG